MKRFKLTILISGLLISVHANSKERNITPTSKIVNVHVKGQVIETVKHQGISCMFINSNKLDNQGNAIAWSHEQGGDVMACSTQALDVKSLKNKFVSVEGEYLTMNHSKKNKDLESYPIVRITHIEKQEPARHSYSAVDFPIGYHDPGFYARTK